MKTAEEQKLYFLSLVSQIEAGNFTIGSSYLKHGNLRSTAYVLPEPSCSIQDVYEGYCEVGLVDFIGKPINLATYYEKLTKEFKDSIKREMSFCFLRIEDEWTELAELLPEYKQFVAQEFNI